MQFKIVNHLENGRQKPQEVTLHNQSIYEILSGAVRQSETEEEGTAPRS